MKLNMTKTKGQLTILAIFVGLCSMFLTSVLIPKPIESTMNNSGATNYQLVTPLPIAAAYAGQYSNGSYFWIDGATWQILEVNSNYTLIEADAISNVTSGTVWMENLTFNYNLTIPKGVSVTENLNGRTRIFINQADSDRSPYTISGGLGNDDGYYFCQDSIGRYLNSYTSTDAATAIQSAINSSTSGETIFIKTGTYALTCQTYLGTERVSLFLNNKSNITIEGESGTVLKLANNQNATMIAIYNGATHNRITGITFDGNKANNLGVEAGMLHPDGVTISLNSMANSVDQSLFTNVKGHPVLIITKSNQNLIHDNTFYNNDWFDIAASGNSAGNIFQNNILNSSIGLESYLSSDTVFAGNSLYNTPRASALSGAVSSIHLDGQDTVYGNYIYNSSRSGIILSPNSKPEQIYGNTIVNPCQNQVAGDAGIYIAGNSKNVWGNTITGSLGRGIYVNYGNDNIISNNYVSNSTLQGILIYQNSNSNIISNNRVFRNLRDIDVEGSPQPQGNILEYNDLSNSSSSFRIYDAGANTLIESNILANSPKVAVNLAGTATTVVGNLGYNPLGYIKNPISGSTFYLVDFGTNSTWISGATYTNWQSPKTLYINGTTVTSITVNGQVTGLGSGSIILQPSDTFSVSFLTAPMIKVMGQ